MGEASALTFLIGDVDVVDSFRATGTAIRFCDVVNKNFRGGHHLFRSELVKGIGFWKL